jgi:bifunctional non-homologous end joining protein LigD
VSDALSEYQAKRNFQETPEPAGSVSAAARQPRFVVQEHHATSLHWDLRLERDGVLVSWALPKGVPPDPRVNHLAVHTEDHPMQYLDFHGEIPEGNYGAGTMTVWDTGTYQTEKWEEREAIVVLHGSRVDGRYALFQTRGNQWMIHRMDPPADPGREVWPGWAAFEPMLAPAGELPSGPFGVEFAWGGERAPTYVSGGRVQARGGLLTRFGELRAMGGALGTTEVVLDGELIVVGTDGRASPALLAERLAARSESTARRLATRHPATLMIYDLLWLDGHSMMGLGYAERRRRLEDGLPRRLVGPAWQVPPGHAIDDGPALVTAARRQGLPGVIAKRLDSRYRGGPAGSDWIFVAV